MKSPIDVVKGRIVDVDANGVVTIKAQYRDWATMIRRGYRECNIQLIDERKISVRQRKACYALIREIAEYTGMGLDYTKEHLKRKFLHEELEVSDEYMFSLSDASVSMACAFQRYLVKFMLDWDIPCGFPLLDFVDDVQDYLYSCLLNKRCCICGKPSDLHHNDHVGMGRNREEIVHEGMEAMPLCRVHHTEMHTIGEVEFERKYHISSGVILDKTLCKIYELKYEEEEEYAEQSDFDGETYAESGAETYEHW